jgi:predicted RNA-binding Zn ribbon-like protein
MTFRTSGAGPLDGRLLDVPREELVFQLDNGRLCLDLVATVGERWRRRFERLRTADDLMRWLAAAGLVTSRWAAAGDLDDQPASAADGHLQAARSLRAAIYASLDAAVDAQPLPQAAVAELNAFARHPEPTPVLDGSTATACLVADDSVGAALSPIARDAIDLITGEDLARVKECPSADCARIFLDTTKSGTRRWCSMRTCGNRAKVRAHRNRASRASDRA